MFEGQASLPAHRAMLNVVLPLPEKRAVLPFERTFTLDEYRRHSQGLVPREVEDKWFVFLEGDTLFCHRSWTGFCIFTVRLAPFEGGYRIVEVLVNRDEEQIRADAAQEVAILSSLLRELLGSSTEAEGG